MNPSVVAPLVGPAAIMLMLVVPLRWHHELRGWRLGAWGLLSGVVTMAALIPLASVVPPHTLAAILAMWLGLPLSGLLALALAERWSWQWTASLATASALCGLLHLLTPAYAADPGAPAADPVVALLLQVAGGQVPSGITLLLGAGLLLRQANGLIDKIGALQWRVHLSMDPKSPVLEVHHHHTPPEPGHDPGLTEPSGVRQAQRRTK